jgi:MoxR-like ATPase
MFEGRRVCLETEKSPRSIKNKSRLMTTTTDSGQMEAQDLQAVEQLKEARASIRKELSKIIIGQNEVVDQTLISIFTRSHSLLVGVPGLAKTLLVSSLAETLDLDFKRIQFTPDLMPSDITGTEVIFQDPETNERQFKFLKGPIFSNIVLADEINRTPPKTQAAMLEAMQERKISIGGQDHDLPNPFFVLATQNPIEQEGTYPLPEAQLDRFMFHIKVDYPDAGEEIDIMKMATGEAPEKPSAVLNGQQILDLQGIVRKLPVSDHVFEYARQLVRVTRVTTDEALPLCKKWLSWGAGPRAGLNMIMAAKAYAMIQGQVHVGTEDVAAVAAPVLRHRIIPNFSATSEGLTTDDIIERILEQVPQKEKLS